MKHYNNIYFLHFYNGFTKKNYDKKSLKFITNHRCPRFIAKNYDRLFYLLNIIMNN